MQINKEKIKNILKRGKQYLPLFLVVIVVFSFFYFNIPTTLAAELSAADKSLRAGDWFVNKIIIGFGWIIYAIVYTVGKFLTFIMGWLVEVAQWNYFIDVPVVITGWVILRDLANMFFVLLLLMVAFATILRVDGYDIKKMVPKILIMAVLINFSKTICGLLIDASQIVMLTFVSGFGNGANSLVDLIGLKDMMSFIEDQSSNNQTLGLSTIAGLLMGLFVALVAFVVITTALVVFIARLVYLWFYVIFSPIAFFAAAFPQGKSYANRWWSEFTQQLTAGPMLAFFIWLALTAAQGTSGMLEKTGKLGVSGDNNGMITSFFSNGVFTTYLITIGLLVVGLIETKKVSGAVGSLAGKGLGYIDKGKGMVTGAASGAAKWGAGHAGRLGLGIAGAGLQRIGGEGGMVSSTGKLLSGMRANLVNDRDSAKYKNRMKTLEKFGIKGDETMGHMRDVANSDAGRRVKGVLGAGAGVLGAATGNVFLAAAGAAVVARNLMGGQVKNYGDRRQADRKGRMDDITNDGKKRIAALEEEKNKRIDRLKEAREGRASAIEASRKDIEDARDEQKRKLEEEMNTKKRNAGSNSRKRGQINNDYAALIGDVDAKAAEDIGRLKAPMSEDAYQKLVASVENRFNSNKVKIDTSTGARKSEIENEKNRQNFLNKWAENYHENKVTYEAAKLGVKETARAEDLIKVVGGGAKIEDFAKNTFYSESGINSQQKKFFEKLAAANAETIEKAVSTLGQIADGSVAASKAQNESIRSLKKGIAAFGNVGGDTTKLNAIVQVVNRIDTGHDDGRNTVEDYKAKVLKG